MYCKNCGAKLEPNDTFCYFCGAKTDISTEFVERDHYHESTSIDTENLVEIYVGENKDKIKEGKFSFPAFFFGPLYLLYRKLGLVALIWIIVDIVAQIIVPKYAWMISIAFSVIFATSFNQFYLETVKNRVEKIKNKNQEKSSDEIIKLVKRKGGVSVASIIVLFFLGIVVSVVIVFIFAFSDIVEEIKDEINTEFPQSDVEDKDLDYEIPKQFEVGMITDYYRRYSYYGDESTCSVKIQNTSSNHYDSVEDYLKYNVYTRGTDKVGTIEEETINNGIWFHQIVETSYSTTHYYASEDSGKLFLIEFEINRDEDKFCSNSYQDFIRSLKFKNNSSNKNDL